MTVQHTKSHFQEELWQPKYVNRDSPEAWASRGGVSYEEVVTQKARDILATHEPTPLPEDVHRKINEIAAASGEALAGIRFVS